MADQSNLFLSILGHIWPRRAPSSVALDADSQSITINRQTVSLTYKAWCVINVLIKSAPATVTRDQIVAQVWGDNSAVGDKGLNHALWVIRTRLDEDAACPELIRTIPRAGYQWIGPALTASVTPRSRRKPAMLAATAISGLLAFAITTSWPSEAAKTPTGDWHDRTISASNGSRAFFEGRKIIVQTSAGCRAILVPDGNMSFGAPTFSHDGLKLAFPLHKGKMCSLVVLDLETHERQKFQSCPARQADLADLSPPLGLTRRSI